MAQATHIPIRLAHLSLVAKLASLEVPDISISPEGDEVRCLGDHLVQLADAVDTYIAAVGQELQSHALCRIDHRLFDGQVLGTLDGFALYEVDRAAEEIDEENHHYARRA